MMIDSSGASPTATGLSPSVEPVPVSPAGAASIPSAEALVQLMAAWLTAPSSKFNAHYPFFAPLHASVMADYGFKPTEMTAATAIVFAELADRLDAQAIEARRAATGTGAVHDGPVG